LHRIISQRDLQVTFLSFFFFSCTHEEAANSNGERLSRAPSSFLTSAASQPNSTKQTARERTPIQFLNLRKRVCLCTPFFFSNFRYCCFSASRVSCFLASPLPGGILCVCVLLICFESLTLSYRVSSLSSSRSIDHFTRALHFPPSSLRAFVCVSQSL
jgi:hypothetical protein